MTTSMGFVEGLHSHSRGKESSFSENVYLNASGKPQGCKMKTVDRIFRKPVLFLVLVIFLASLISGEKNVAAQKNVSSRQSSALPPRFVVYHPGVNWSGKLEKGNYGEMLNPDKITVHIRHEGLLPGKWEEVRTNSSTYVVKLPRKWDEAAAARQLLPVVEAAFKTGREIHFVVDKNVNIVQHVLPFVANRGEDKWAGQVTNYITRNRNPAYEGIFASHSRGTDSARWVEFEPFKTAIVASPRGDDALSWIARAPSKSDIYIITGIADLPNLRISQRYSTIIREHPNVKIVQLQPNQTDILDAPLPTAIRTHSALANLDTTGQWKLISGSGSKAYQGSLREVFTGDRSYQTTGSYPAGSEVGSIRTAPRTGNVVTPGGVSINVSPMPIGKMESNYSREVLGKRPAKDTPSWPIKIPEIIK
jgi:hypothetical protein